MVQETTFNSAYQADGSENILSVHQWLDAHYAGGSPKKIDEQGFLHLISHVHSFIFLEKKIGYAYKDKKILAQAFLQTTFCHEHKAMRLNSNERLEFLGDSLLNAMVAEILYHQYSEKNEGGLSKLRGALVNEASLAELARVLHLEDNLFLGRGEFASNGHLKDSILADAFESLLGSLYIDSDHDYTLLKSIFANIIQLFEQKSGKKFFDENEAQDFDPKSALQELCVAKNGVFPQYKSREENGGFTVELWIGEKMIGSHFGLSKKKSEKELAKKILDEKLY